MNYYSVNINQNEMKFFTCVVRDEFTYKLAAMTTHSDPASLDGF